MISTAVAQPSNRETYKYSIFNYKSTKTVVKIMSCYSEDQIEPVSVGEILRYSTSKEAIRHFHFVAPRLSK